MADMKPTKEQLEQYREWYKETYPDMPKSMQVSTGIRGITKQVNPFEYNWNTNEYWQHWRRYVQKVGWYKPPVAGYEGEYGYPTLTLTEYERALNIYLRHLVDKKQKTTEEALTLGQQAMEQANLYGINPDLPFYQEISSLQVTPEWLEKQATLEQREKVSALKAMSEVIPNRLWMSPEGRYLNVSGEEITKEVADFMMKTAGQYGGRKVAGQIQPPISRRERIEGDQLGRIEQRTRELMAEERAFEERKAGQLAQLTEPRDWIQRYIVDRMQNPITPESYPVRWADRTPEQRAIKLLWGSMAYRPDFALRPQYEAGYSASTMPEYERALEEQKAGYYATGGETLPPIEPGPYPVAFQKTEAGDWAMYQASREDIGKVPTSKYPPAPDWITRYVPALRAGKPIFAAPMKIPSGQQLATMTPTEQQMLQGYTGWASQQGRWRGMEGEGGRKAQEAIPRLSWEDIMAQVELMRPAGGRGVRSYAPIRRR